MPTHVYYVIVTALTTKTTLFVDKFYGKTAYRHNAKSFYSKSEAKLEAEKWKYGRIQEVRIC